MRQPSSPDGGLLLAANTGRKMGNRIVVRYLVERTFADGLAIPVSEDGATVCRTVVANA